MSIQIIIVAFALFAFLRAVKQFRKGSLTGRWLVFWSLFWVAVSTVVLLPQTTDIVASFVGVGRGVDVVVYLSIVVLFYFVFRIFVRIEDLERDITRLVRTISLHHMTGESEESEKKD